MFSKKIVLGTCYKIAPWGTQTWLIIGTREQDCLIEYEIIPNDTPILYFQKGFGLEKDLELSKILAGGGEIFRVAFLFSIQQIFFSGYKPPARLPERTSPVPQYLPKNLPKQLTKSSQWQLVSHGQPSPALARIQDVTHLRSTLANRSHITSQYLPTYNSTCAPNLVVCSLLFPAL